MCEIIELFPKQEEDSNHPHMPQKYWQCGCEHVLFYMTPVRNTYELVCYGCGKTQEWNTPC